MWNKIKNIYIGTTQVRPVRWLPNTYQAVEYIQSSGTQYINTGYIPSNNTKIELSMWWYSQTSAYSCLFGARLAWASSASAWKWFLVGREIDGTPTVYAMFWWYYQNINDSIFSYKDGNKHIIELSQSWVYEDGTPKQSISSATFTSPVNLVLFANNDNGTVSEYSTMKIYYTKVYNSWSLVRDFIPCYRKSDSVIWLYDRVNNQFYTNAGTWTFTKWGDI